MDILSDILSKVRLSSVIYFKSDFSEPWGMNIPKGKFAQFHIVTEGHCVLKSEHDDIHLFPGEIVVFPFGASHWLANSKQSKRYPGQKVVESILSGNSLFSGNRISTTQICGHFEFDQSLDHPFIQELPSIIHIRDADLNHFSWLKSITDLVIEEAGKEHSGSDIIVNKLGEILFIHTLRAFIELNNADKGFIAAFKDDRISKVLKAIHSSIQKDWSIEQLAQISAMSRTSFVTHFKSLTGETPFNYIRQWRLIKAQELLRETTLSVGVIADQVGYNSEAAFNRVFKKVVTLTPLKFRQSLLV